MGTSNNLQSLSPELRSRFTCGTFFFDLPTDAERKSIWKLYGKKTKISQVEIDDIDFDNGWTGREIKACVDISRRISCSLKSASNYIVPIVRSAPEKIKALRELADGKFLNASAPGGIYTLDLPGMPVVDPERSLKF